MRLTRRKRINAFAFAYTCVVALIVTLPAPSNPAQSGSDAVRAKPTNAPLVVNVLDYGARADNGVTDNAEAFQRAIDDVASRKGTWVGHGGTVYVPSSPTPYGFRRPVWLDQDGITLRGDSAESTRLLAVGGHHPVLVSGVRRGEPYAEGGVTKFRTPTAANRADAFGKLDATAAPRPGVRWGYRSSGDTFLQFQATPLSVGVKDPAGLNHSDDWGTTSALTVELCVEPPDGQAFPPNAPLTGAGRNDPLDPRPILMQTWDDPGTIIVLYRPSTLPDDDPNGYDGFSFPLGDAKPPYRIAVSIDLKAGEFLAFVNGQTRKVDDVKRKAVAGRFAPQPAATFSPNRYEPWLVGALGERGPVGRSSTGVDLRCYGLRVSRVARYRADGAGRQVRADTGQPPTDAWAYLGDDQATIAYLPFDDPPSPSRGVAVQAGGATWGGRCLGFLLHCQAPQPVSRGSIKDLSVVGGGPYGYAIALGAVIDQRIERVYAAQAYYAVGSVCRQANYRIFLSDLELAGAGSGYFGYMQIVCADRIHFEVSGRSTVKLVGSGSRWRDLMVARPSPVSEHTFEGIGRGYGGAHTIENLVVDYEGDAYRPGGSAVYCEAHPDTPATSLTLRDCFFGKLGPDVALIDLRGGPEGRTFRPAWFDAVNVQTWEANKPAIRIDGPLWRGSFRGLGAGAGPQVVNSKRFGDTVNVTVP